MDHKSTVIVLHTIKYGDSSLVVNTYTREYGPLTYMVRGVKGKSRRANMFQPLSILNISATHPRKGTMMNVREVSFEVSYNSIPFDMVKRSVGMFISEIIYKTLKDEQPNELLFDFIQNFLIDLDENPWSPDKHFSFLAGLAFHLGIQPEISNVELSYFDLREGSFVGVEPDHPDYLDGDSASCFAKLSRLRVGDSPTFSMTPEMRKKMLSSWVDYLRLHLEGMGEIKSHKVLEAVLR